MTAAVPRLARVTLVFGGARSGKSRYAENLLAACPEKVYLATATAGDVEMEKRIAEHRARRGEGWSTVEEPLEIVDIIAREGKAGRPLLVDCLTLWAMNFVSAGRDGGKEVTRLFEALNQSPGPVVMVSNEIGLGVIPENQLSRLFVDLQGQVNQLAAQAATRVVFVAAGLPLIMKDETA
ncbi:MAG: bifunctional adenosylcobinamide kinase/adenosylcobinamide-phosphate guanylyltransferase [Rhodospirillaceae bacterium]